MTGPAPLAMFPLEVAVLPGEMVPLRVFEPRYLRLLDDIGPSGTLGTVLIARGSEVGGDDVRHDVGVRLRLVAPPRPGPVRGIVVGATGRIRVDRWLPDAPYPRAVVEDWPDEGPTCEPGAVADLQRHLRRVLGLAAELGARVPPAEITLPPDPAAASWMAAAAAGLGQLDRYRLLATPGAGERIVHLNRMLSELAVMLEARLAAGG